MRSPQQPQETEVQKYYKKKQEERELRNAMDLIEKRAVRHELALAQTFATSDISPFSSNSFYVRHAKEVGFVSIECFHATFFHFVDTVKVRGMARNMFQDVSLYFKNQVQYKPMISGVVSGFLGALAGGLTFITTYNSLTYYFYSNKRYVDWDFRLKNLIIYLSSDFTASVAKVFLEARKQLIQMQIYEQPLPAIARAAALGWFPLMFRDLAFRTILLGTYYGTTEMQHEPKLKYTIPQIADIMRQRRAEGHYETFEEISYMFYDYQNYEVRTRLHIRYLYLILANMIGTLLTNPIDVCLTKIMTQQEPKYSGFWNCLATVYKEEGAKKFLSGIHPRFMLNLFSGSLYLFVYSKFVQHIDSIYK